MNRFGTRLVGATATPPPPQPKARSNENLDKIDMSLGKEPSWTELEWGEGVGGTKYRGLWGKGRLAAVLGRVFPYGWAEPSEGPRGHGVRHLVRCLSQRDPGVPSAGLCLRRGGGSGRRCGLAGFGGSRGATSCGRPGLFVRKTRRLSPQACSFVGAVGIEGRGPTEPSSPKKPLESPAGSAFG